MNVNISEDNKSPLSGLQPNYDFINNYGTNPIMIGILLLVVISYYFIIDFSSKTDKAASVAAAASGATKSTSTNWLETLLWILFIVLLVLNVVLEMSQDKAHSSSVSFSCVMTPSPINR